MLGTLPIKAVARELLRKPEAARWSYEVAKAIKSNDAISISRGSIGRILRQMEREGWLTSHLEPVKDAIGRPGRRYFQANSRGIHKLEQMAVDSEAQSITAGQ